MAAFVHALRYLFQIWLNLPGNWEQKKPILCRVAACVRDFVSNRPDADYATITARFGTPQQIAEASLENMDVTELAQELRVRRIIVRIVAITALSVVLLWAGVVGLALAENRASRNGYITDEVDVIERIEYEDEEQ